MTSNTPSSKNDNKVTLYKGIFGFQIYLLKDRTYPRMTALYDSCGFKRSEDDYDSWIKALKDKVGFTRPEPKIDQDGYSYIESTTLNIDASELFELLTYRQFKTKKDNATEERFFVMLCYIAMYEYQCDRGNYHDALTCISYANCVYGTFGNLDFAKNIILSDSARNNARKREYLSSPQKSLVQQYYIEKLKIKKTSLAEAVRQLKKSNKLWSTISESTLKIWIKEVKDAK